MQADWSARLKSLTGEPSSDAADDAPRRRRVGLTRSEMMVQGAAITRTLEREAEATSALADLAVRRNVRRIVIVGCGDSWFAGIAARHAIEVLTGLPVEAAQAYDWAHYTAAGPGADTLVIGLSSGGNTPAVVAALEHAAAAGALAVGLSNTAASPVLTRFDAGLVVHATRRGWPTQSSTAAAALLVAIGSAIGRRRLGQSPRAAALDQSLAGLGAVMDQVAVDLDEPARAMAEALAGTSLVLFTGAGPHFAAAAFGAAKVRELAPIHAFALPLEEYHHYRSQKQGDPLFLVAPDGISRERALDTALVGASVGGNTIALLGGPDADIEARVTAAWRLPIPHALLAPLVCSVPLHLFAYHFAEARFARSLGYPPALASTATT